MDTILTIFVNSNVVKFDIKGLIDRLNVIHRDPVTGILTPMSVIDTVPIQDIDAEYISPEEYLADMKTKRYMSQALLESDVGIPPQGTKFEPLKFFEGDTTGKRVLLLKFKIPISLKDTTLKGKIESKDEYVRINTKCSNRNYPLPLTVRFAKERIGINRVSIARSQLYDDYLEKLDGNIGGLSIRGNHLTSAEMDCVIRNIDKITELQINHHESNREIFEEIVRRAGKDAFSSLTKLDGSSLSIPMFLEYFSNRRIELLDCRTATHTPELEVGTLRCRAIPITLGSVERAEISTSCNAKLMEYSNHDKFNLLDNILQAIPVDNGVPKLVPKAIDLSHIKSRERTEISIQIKFADHEEIDQVKSMTLNLDLTTTFLSNVKSGKSTRNK